jgi:Na+-transporting methylmalonyl-CoA/oxaloacetate decarboxylase gamma subunit
MFCPNCAAPIDGVKFCRSCGSNVSLVSQAMSGQLPQSEASEGELHIGIHHLGRHHHRKKELSPENNVDHAMTELFTGIGFVIAAVAILIYVPSGVFWWWSFLIPALALIGAGVGKYLRWREQQRKQEALNLSASQPVAYQSSAHSPALSAPTTSELVKPSSVTEHTTRHLE